MNKNSTNFNAWANNTLKTRKDVAQAFEQQGEPLIPAFAEDAARVCLADTSALFSMESAELEGFARPLWGIVPFVYGGGEFKHWEVFRRGYPTEQTQVIQSFGKMLMISISIWLNWLPLVLHYALFPSIFGIL